MHRIKAHRERERERERRKREREKECEREREENQMQKIGKIDNEIKVHFCSMMLFRYWDSKESYFTRQLGSGGGMEVVNFDLYR